MLQRIVKPLIAVGMLAVLMTVGVAPFTSELAVANSCPSCRAAHDACRIKKKGHPSCDRELRKCLQNCLKPYRKK